MPEDAFATFAVQNSDLLKSIGSYPDDVRNRPPPASCSRNIQLSRDLDFDLLAGVVRAIEAQRQSPDIEQARHRYGLAVEHDIAINPVARGHQQLSHHGGLVCARGDVEEGGIVSAGAQY